MRSPLKLSLVVGLLCASCPGVSTQTVATDVTIAVQDVLCLIQTYSAEVGGGVVPAQAVLDAASKCQVAQTAATTILASHVAAEQAEHGVNPDGGAPATAKKAQ
jgi:hypothetical protein